MQERIKEIPNKFKEFWSKYTGKQKTIIISVICVVLIAIGITAWFVSRPSWTMFQAFENLDDANSMANALDGAGIKYKASNNGLTLYVKEGDMTDALYTMSDNGLADKGYTWDKAFDNSMSTTESEKSQKRILALQSQIKQALVKYSFIDDADVFIDVPATSYKVLEDADKNATSITAVVSVSDKNKEEITTERAEALAYWLANAVGTDVSNVVINDDEGHNIFNGSLDDGLGGALAGGSSEYVSKLRQTIKQNIINLLLSCDYDDIEVGTDNIRFDMRKIETLRRSYDVNEGMENGYPGKLYRYEATGTYATPNGEPGTQSNDDDTDTMIGQGTGSNSSVTIEKLEDILTNETVENIKQEKPAIQTDISSIGIVATRYIIYDEEQLENDGTLDGMTFEEFIAQNNNRNVVQATAEEIALISAATGIDEGNISIVAYEVPQFVEKTETSRELSDYLMIILAVLIIALLIFVVLRGTAPVKAADEEPELSVEQLLATTKENQSLDDIEFSEKSETRKMIEKFVDENPEAVAQLLRNWLNEDWN
ncbi:MAG: hypothetical protein OSJ45_16560 [Lachnospiraceae bacterium]|nr:hypothetical protein [Lachnospiraceae bacterium]